MKLKSIINISVTTIFVIANFGCKSFIPGQSNSAQSDGERVDLKMLAFEDFNDPLLVSNYVKAFNHPPNQNDPNTARILTTDGEVHPRLVGAAILIPLAIAAAGAAVNYVSQSISNQASEFQAQFGDSFSASDFWKRTSDGTNKFYVPKYCGFELTRRVIENKSLTDAFDLVCGIGFTEDGELMLVKPLTFSTTKSKAKVFDASGLGWLSEIFSSTLHAGNKLNSTVDIKCDGYYKDSNQALQTVPMGAFSFKFTGYDIIKTPTLSQIDSNNAISKQTSGFLDTAPFSYDPTTKGVRATEKTGNFVLTVNVTEADASNVKENLEKLGQLVSQQKSTINLAITNTFPSE